ncbi:MAG: BatD family protein, partial [Oceanobacter sp.]
MQIAKSDFSAMPTPQQKARPDIRATTSILAAVLALLLFSVSAWAGSLVSGVDRTRISEQDTLKLTVTMEPRSSNGVPDFSLLNKDFQILRGPSTSSSTQWVNGDFSSKTQWTLMLLPLRTGDLTIPAFEVDGSKSQPISIQVNGMSSSVRDQTQQEAFFDIEVSKLPAYYVQGEILYTEKLYYRVNHQDASLSELQVEDARVEALSDPKRYTSVINGERVGVYERQYVIYPEKAGTLIIPGQRFQALASRQSNPFDRWGTQQYMINAVTRPIELKVDPIPADYPTAPWLPARKLTLKESYSSDPNEWRVGDAITRTISIETEGMSARQVVLPEITLPDGIKGYPDQASYEDRTSAKGTQGNFSQAMALVPTQSGKLELPAVRIAWWNLERNKLEFAEIPPRVLTIQPAIAGSPGSQSAATSSPSNTPQQNAAPALASGNTQLDTNETSGFSVWWLVATLILLAT